MHFWLINFAKNVNIGMVFFAKNVSEFEFEYILT